jgi:hypothetical protein
MAVSLSPLGGVAGQFFDNNGVPLSGGLLYTYAAGTTTAQATYFNASGVILNANPIVLDAGGRVPNEIWLNSGLSYKFVLKTSAGVLIGSWDNITGINSNFVNYNAQEQIQTATAGQTVFTLTGGLSYTPGTNTLQVFVDGVNQYDGSSYSYTETNSTTVTFTQGLHVGALVKFTTAVALSAGVVSSNLVTYQPAGSAAVQTTVQAKLRESVSVKDFGATGNGTTDDTAAIQAALDYIVNSTIPNVLLFPAGTYKCTLGLTVNCGYVSCSSDRALLDFSTLGDQAAITFIGGNPYSGNPYNQDNCFFSGFKIIGPSTSIAAGLFFTASSEPGPSHMIVRDCNISNFNNGITFLNNAYLMTFEHCDIWNCYRGIYSQTGSNSGENIRFNNGAIYNILYEGVRNDNGSADLNFYATSFDGFVSAVVVTAGQVSITGCHFESYTSSKALVISANSFVTCTGCYFLNDYATQDQYIVNSGYLSIFGGRIFASNTATNIVYSTSRLSIVGLHFQTSSTTTVTAIGNYLIYLPNDGSLGTNGAIRSVSKVDSAKFASDNTVSISALNTWTNLGVGTSSGLFAFRDNTSGGTALFMADTSAGAASVQNGITGFAMRYSGGQMQIQVTSGTVPRTIKYSLLQTNAS